MTTLTQIQNFLGRKRIAVVGGARNPQDFTRTLFNDPRSRHYDVVAVNPNLEHIGGEPCCARVADIDPPAEAALLMTNPAATERVVRECHAAGIREIWMYRGAGTGAVSADAVEFCEANGMPVVAGECPFMFLPETPWFHTFHGFCRKIVGAYPK